MPRTAIYDRDDIARLHQIQALRRFGLALAEIQTCLTQPRTPLASIVARQIAMLDGKEPELMAGTWADETLLAFIREAIANVAQPL